MDELMPLDDWELQDWASLVSVWECYEMQPLFILPLIMALPA
jgi:hypothetical protein